MKLLVYLFLVFLCVVTYFFRLLLGRKREIPPGHRKLYVNGLIHKSRDEEEDDWGYRKF